MDTFATALETFAVDNGGIYPDNVEILFNEAKEKNYWKDLINPFNFKKGVNLSFMDYEEYEKRKPGPELKGLMLYKKINIVFNKELNKNICIYYNVYATNENGEILKENNKIILLENQ